MELLELTLGRAINLLVLLVITLFLLGLVSKAVRWLWEIWGGHR